MRTMMEMMQQMEIRREERLTQIARQERIDEAERRRQERQELREAVARDAERQRKEREDDADRYNQLLQIVLDRQLASQDSRPTGASSSRTSIPDDQVAAPVVEKVTFSKYDGKMDATVIHSWLHQFNAYFATRTMSSNSKVLLAAIYLAGDAINWYHAW